MNLPPQRPHNQQGLRRAPDADDVAGRRLNRSYTPSPLDQQGLHRAAGAVHLTTSTPARQARAQQPPASLPSARPTRRRPATTGRQRTPPTRVGGKSSTRLRTRYYGTTTNATHQSRREVVHETPNPRLRDDNERHPPESAGSRPRDSEPATTGRQRTPPTRVGGKSSTRLRTRDYGTTTNATHPSRREVVHETPNPLLRDDNERHPPSGDRTGHGARLRGRADRRNGAAPTALRPRRAACLPPQAPRCPPRWRECWPSADAGLQAFPARARPAPVVCAFDGL